MKTVFLFFTILQDEIKWNDEEVTIVSGGESNVGYLLFEKEKFKVTSEILYSDYECDGAFCVQSADDLMLVIDNFIIPYNYDNGMYTFNIPIDMPVRDGIIYNFTDLTKSEISKE